MHAFVYADQFSYFVICVLLCRELGMMGSPGLDAMNGELKYPGDCYSPKFAADPYQRGKNC